MSVADNVTSAVKKVPRRTWYIAVGVGAGIGLLILWRNRDTRPEDVEPDTTPADALNYGQAGMVPSPSYAGDYGGGGVGMSVPAGDPAVNIGGGYIPLESLFTALGGLAALGGLVPATDIFNYPGAVGGGPPVSPSPTEVQTAPPPPPAPPPLPPPPPAPPTALIAQTGSGSMGAAPPPQLHIDPPCPDSHPYHNASYKGRPWGCYRVVLKGSERWHYYYDGRKVRVS